MATNDLELSAEGLERPPAPCSNEAMRRLQ